MEKFIVRNLYRRLGLSFEKHDGWTLVDYVNHAKASARGQEMEDASIHSKVTPQESEANKAIGKMYGLLVAANDRHLAQLKAKSESDFFQQVCDSLKRADYARLVWIGLAEKGSFDMKPVAFAGFEDGYLSSIKVTWDDSEYGKGPTGMARTMPK